MSDDQRQFSRIPFDAQVRLSTGEGQWTSGLLDLSLKGALIERPEGWDAKPGDTGVIELTLGEDVTIRMEVSVAHLEEGRAGFHCDHIDVDSITHLRRLVELNLGDPQLLERELSHLG